MTRAEEQNEIAHKLLEKIAEDKKHYKEYKAIKSKLEYISDQINTRVTDELKKEKDGSAI